MLFPLRREPGPLVRWPGEQAEYRRGGAPARDRRAWTRTNPPLGSIWSSGCPSAVVCRAAQLRTRRVWERGEHEVDGKVVRARLVSGGPPRPGHHASGCSHPTPSVRGGQPRYSPRPPWGWAVRLAMRAPVHRGLERKAIGVNGYRASQPGLHRHPGGYSLDNDARVETRSCSVATLRAGWYPTRNVPSGVGCLAPTVPAPPADRRQRAPTTSPSPEGPDWRRPPSWVPPVVIAPTVWGQPLRLVRSAGTSGWSACQRRKRSA